MREADEKVLWKGGQKNHPHQAILVLNLTTLILNDILIIDFLDIEFSGEWMFSECKIGHNGSRSKKIVSNGQHS